MSHINRSITDNEVIPVVESDLFAEQPDSRFAVGILAVNDQAMPGLESEYRGYFDLRRRVYVDQTGQLDETDIGEDGTDRDVDDSRSVAFGVIENRRTDARVVAVTRLIIKNAAELDNPQSGEPLPIEDFCPEFFTDTEVGDGGIEVSRLIARHERAAVKEVITWKLYATALSYIANHDLGPTYGVIEPWLKRHLNSTIPLKRIGEARYVEHYLDENLPIEVDTGKFIDLVEAKYPGMISQMRANEKRMSYFGKLAMPARSNEAAVA